MPGTLRVDLANEFVWRGEQAIRLRPKTFALLRCLAERPGEVVSKSILSAVVWPDVAVTDNGLMVGIAELRRALGDDPMAPRFIETLPRRGYRLLTEVRFVTAAPADPASRRTVAVAPLPAAGAPTVGRALEMERLHAWLDKALAGSRQVAFLTGEAGAGKTTLVEAFLAQARADTSLLVGRGQCVEHYGAGEAYLPILEALGQLCRGRAGREVVALLTRYAPAWAVQMPGLVEPAEREALQQRALSATPERMLRELAEALEILTEERPLLLVLEDLHWSDPSTRALIVRLARRAEWSRLLLLGTYRPDEADPTAPRMRAIDEDLRLHGRAEELALAGLDERAVGEYLLARLPGSIAPGVARLLHARTDGNPLFMIHTVEHWLAQGWLAARAGVWALRAEPRAIAAGVPDNLRQMVRRWVDALDEGGQRALEAGSAAGVEFSAAVAAAALGEDVAVVEARCARLARDGQLLRASGEETWPDRTTSARFAFVHALYRDVLYAGLPPARRAEAHRRIAARLAAAHGERAGEIAVPLAMHFERGEDAPRAVAFLRRAAETAARRFASLEAVEHLSRALGLLAWLPEGLERVRLELSVLAALGPALAAIKGHGADEVERLYARARTLAESLDAPAQLFPILRGLVTIHQHRGDLPRARALTGELAALARRAGDAGLELQAEQALAITAYYQGEHAFARERLEWCIVHHEIAHHGSRPCRSGLCTAVVCEAHLVWAVWNLGYPTQALAAARSALGLAREMGHPNGVACALYSAATLALASRDVAGTREAAESLVTLAAEHGFAFWRMYGAVLQGWALAMQGHGDEGRSLIRKNVEALRQTGTEVGRPYFLFLLAEACLKGGRVEAGLEAVDEALAAVAGGERYWEAELHRLRGELLWRGAQRQRAGQRAPIRHDAEASLHRALDVARRQQARSLELRAAVSLATMSERTGDRRAAHRLLAQTYGWFTEGFDTFDLKAARTLLARLGS